MHVELRIDVFKVLLDCSWRNHQSPGNLLVGESGGNQLKHLHFPFAQWLLKSCDYCRCDNLILASGKGTPCR